MKSGYTIAQVAKQVGVSYRTIRRRVNDGLIPAITFGEKTTRISRETLQRLKTHGLQGMPDAKRLPWQTDITRHSWISYRLALVNDEARVAREAGNSPDVIYRHYFQLVSGGLAAGYFACSA